MTEKTDTIKIEIKREFINLHSYTLYSPNKETYIPFFLQRSNEYLKKCNLFFTFFSFYQLQYKNVCTYIAYTNKDLTIHKKKCKHNLKAPKRIKITKNSQLY